MIPSPTDPAALTVKRVPFNRSRCVSKAMTIESAMPSVSSSRRVRRAATLDGSESNMRAPT
jgi:hypothetical protein